MPERGNLGENLIPEYKFEWDDGTERTSSELKEQYPDAIEALAQLGREDDECEVSLVGYET